MKPPSRRNYDVIRGSTLAGISDPVTYQTSHNAFGVNGSITLSLSVVSAGVKDPTFLWLPTDNGTVNGLPTGLERYTGEQSFDLVLVNASTTVAPVAIHEPWGGSYALACLLSVSSLGSPSPPSDSVINEAFAVTGAVLATLAFGFVSLKENDPVVDAIAGVATTVAWASAAYVYVYG